MDMKKSRSKKQTFKNPLKTVILSLFVSLLIAAFLAILSIWVLWPVEKKSLQRPNVQRLSFTEAKAKVANINADEKARGIKPNCYSKLNVHEQPSAKTVVMFHGVSACPAQFADLAQYFYARGYNVYSPLAPEHGYSDNLTHANVTAQQLVDYTNTSINIGSGLGEETGVIGLSGGGNLATWAAQYRPGISRILTLSPFYEPSTAQAPKWQMRPLLVLHGNNFLLPDQLNKPEDPQHSLSYRAIAKYMIVFKNLPRPAQDIGLKHVAVVMADDDDQIDQPLALKTLRGIASANHQQLAHYQLPASLKLGHDIISPDNKHVVEHAVFLHQKYFELYEQ